MKRWSLILFMWKRGRGKNTAATVKADKIFGNLYKSLAVPGPREPSFGLTLIDCEKALRNRAERSTIFKPDGTAAHT